MNGIAKDILFTLYASLVVRIQSDNDPTFINQSEEEMHELINENNPEGKKKDIFLDNFKKKHSAFFLKLLCITCVDDLEETFNSFRKLIDIIAKSFDDPNVLDELDEFQNYQAHIGNMNYAVDQLNQETKISKDKKLTELKSLIELNKSLDTEVSFCKEKELKIKSFDEVKFYQNNNVEKIERNGYYAIHDLMYLIDSLNRKIATNKS
ncbi:hypothetical protein TRFO_10986 [Tritrichomonas foetus]|uniref:Uncharacterized protein n=1 Tax=Tritrichomonas foetus TaxID=1144522 RepID=A0A1J4JB02_9EUKA|nr:hypothetical protein TRFO_10986 [Tritrichomonas foetus]|eukprot:OHS94613.1 hypothetical protein TRFO_10986 [Tritrichomonas foetus]